MAKILGLDLGTKSIGWALVEKEENKLLQAGVSIFPDQSLKTKTKAKQIRRHNYRLAQTLKADEPFQSNKKPIALKILKIFTLLTMFIAFINFSNWQFWANISLTSLVVLLTILHQDKK